MKRLLCGLAACLAAFAVAVPTVALADEMPETPEVTEENNLAASKYDWDVVTNGAATLSFSGGNFRLENINGGSDGYALYTANKFNEFTLDFYAKLNLPCPSDLGLSTQNGNWTSLYLSFYIDFDDAKKVENAAKAACPWAMNKGSFEILFERISGSTAVNYMIHENFSNNPHKRYYLKQSAAAKVDWCDDEYHRITVTARSTRTGDAQTSGCTYAVYIDGTKQSEVFLCDRIYSNEKLDFVEYKFSEIKGYFGFWAMTSIENGKLFSDTGAVVDIKELTITSYDGESPVTFTKSAKPVFPISANTSYSPEAGYEAEEEVEIRLSDLFVYEGDEKVNYTATYDGAPIGAVKNGYFVYAFPEKGIYDVDFTATTADGESATNKVRLRINESSAPVVDPPESSSGTSEEVSSASETGGQSAGGCGSGMGAPAVLAVLALGAIAAAKAKRG